MSDLRTVAALHARVYAFLEQQDDATLRAIVDGTARLAAVRADDEPTTPPPPAAAPAVTPSRDPFQVARDLTTLTTEPERRVYLNATRLTVPELKRVAKSYGLGNYSGLTRAVLIARLAGHEPGRTDEPATPAWPSPRPRTAQPTREPDGEPDGEPDVDAALVATRLRETETEQQGADYLRTQGLDRDGLLAVAAELRLTRVDRLSQSELEKRVLKQAIGARRKFSGLRKW